MASDADVIKDAREMFRQSDDGMSHNRDNYKEDTLFARLAKQWPENIRKQREQEGRPILTINKLPAFIRQVVNESRQNKPGISIGPVDNGADVDTAEVISGLIRSVERRSQADIAYDTAIDHAVTGGFGYFQIEIDYAHTDSFDLEARIKRIPNPLMVHQDVDSSQFDASDWNYAFVSEFYSEKEFKRDFPKADPISWADMEDGHISDWKVENDHVRVAQFWLREQDERDLILFENQAGEQKAIRETQLPILAKAAADAAGMDIKGIPERDLIQLFLELTGMQERRRRKVKYNKVTKYLINGLEVLRTEPWPGSLIPICPVYGEEVILEGRRHFRSMVRDAKDPQQMFNFWRSASTELVALAPRAPWVGPTGFIPEGEENKWETANTRSWAFLEYDPQAGPAPKREAFAGVPAGALQESLNANDDMKSIIGIYDSSIGKESNEKSGKAILARERQSDTSNFHFMDNLSRAIDYGGRVLVEILPAVYSDRQTVRILGEDMKEKVVKLTQEDGGGMVGPDGKRELFNLSVGNYDVDVKTGPSYATQREETRETLIEIMRAVPAAAQYIGDVLLEHMDFQGADKVAKRLQALLPPAVQQAEGLPVTAPTAPLGVNGAAPPQGPQGV